MTNSSGKVGQVWVVDTDGVDSTENMAEQIMKGDWVAVGIEDKDGYAESVAYCHPANAALIAAAPVLLKACQKALEACKQTMCPNGLYFKDEWPQAFKGLEEAIAQAEGRG